MFTYKKDKSAFTTASERQNGNLFPFFLRAAGTKPSTIDNKNGGFTLIELLVVIAIIGLLSSVVLASLSGARESAREAAILSGLNQASSQAEIYYNQNGSYAGLCDDEKISKIIANLRSTGDDAACLQASDTPYYVEPPADKLARRDWGIGVKDGDSYFVGSPLGAGTLAEENAAGGTQPFGSAESACSSENQRLPSPSALSALYRMDSATPEGYTADSYWSGLTSSGSEAWRTRLGNGSMYRSSQSSGRYVRCVR